MPSQRLVLYDRWQRHPLLVDGALPTELREAPLKMAAAAEAARKAVAQPYQEEEQ